jgi:hypothetical protein
VRTSWPEIPPPFPDMRRASAAAAGSAGVCRPDYTNSRARGRGRRHREPGRHEEYWRLLPVGNTGARHVDPGEADSPPFAIFSASKAATMARRTSAGSVQDQVLVPVEKIFLAADVLPP